MMRWRLAANSGSQYRQTQLWCHLTSLTSYQMATGACCVDWMAWHWHCPMVCGSNLLCIVLHRSDNCQFTITIMLKSSNRRRRRDSLVVTQHTYVVSHHNRAWMSTLHSFVRECHHRWTPFNASQFAYLIISILHISVAALVNTTRHSAPTIFASPMSPWPLLIVAQP